jgi:hypothetical protein
MPALWRVMAAWKRAGPAEAGGGVVEEAMVIVRILAEETVYGSFDGSVDLVYGLRMEAV